MVEYLRESWDLHAGALVAFALLALLLFWCGALPLWAVPLVAVVGAVLSVFGGLWLLVLCGGSVPW